MSTWFLELPRAPLPGPRPMALLGAKANMLRFIGDPVAAMLRARVDYKMVGVVAGPHAMPLHISPASERVATPAAVSGSCRALIEFC